ncbi:hypothetical protein [Nonlabens agnitus]|uniref:Transporter n=1 Tax=Nonlabens agnitus TaxID=870484 RepID=A0A2S9WR85_9FLAO|nr:hypothetical protein [Nonlabens agnitus]PRP65978.1 hypothetical protein BST86_02180 [Nonlabens agnitus]
MKTTSITILFIAFLGLSIFSKASAQGLVDGFYNGAGKLTAVLGAGYEDNPTYLAGKNELDLEKSFLNVNTFLAYGLTDRWELNLAAAYVKSDQEAGLQDARFITKFKAVEHKTNQYELSTTIAGGIAFPLTDYETEGLNAIGQRATRFPLRALLHVQKANGWFATAQAGYTPTLNPTPDSNTASLKLGVAKSSYYIDAFIDYQNSLNGRDYRGFPAPNNFRELEVDFLRAGITFYKPFGLRAGAFVNTAYTFNGRNVGLGPAVNIGLVYKTFL